MFNKNKFKAQMALLGMTSKDLAKSLDVDESTLYRKIQNDGNFTRKEINQLIEILEIENPKEIFFADELAETQERR